MVRLTAVGFSSCRYKMFLSTQIISRSTQQQQHLKTTARLSSCLPDWQNQWMKAGIQWRKTTWKAVFTAMHNELAARRQSERGRCSVIHSSLMIIYTCGGEIWDLNQGRLVNEDCSQHLNTFSIWKYWALLSKNVYNHPPGRFVEIH